VTINADIDIDFGNRDAVLEDLVHIKASIIKRGDLARHISGVYLQDIPVDPGTELASFDHVCASELGYFKLDFLHVSLYERVRNDEHLDQLCNTEPLWCMLEDETIVRTLFHLRDQFSLVKQFKPKSIDDLAIVLAIKLPAKRYLIDCCPEQIREEIWRPVEGHFAMKKSHAYAYAQVVIVNMNLLVEEALELSH
jgi:hypothetical protein